MLPPPRKTGMSFEFRMKNGAHGVLSIPEDDLHTILSAFREGQEWITISNDITTVVINRSEVSYYQYWKN